MIDSSLSLSRPSGWNRDVIDRIEVRRFAGPEVYAQQLTRPIRVAHLTDQHVGLVTPMKVQHAAVQLANAEAPDLVVLTGDFVCHSQAYLDALQEVLAGFDAPIVGVIGNHDHWAGVEAVRWALGRAGVEVLDNQHTTISFGSDRLQLVGVDDAYTGHADVGQAIHGLRRDLPTLGLSHLAEEADKFWGAGVPLVLSGHTHAGQLTLARINELAVGRLSGHRYIHGLYGTRKQGPAPFGAVYVGAGIGAAVVPLRLGERARREVTIFELGLAPGSIEEHHDEQDALPGRKVTERMMARRARKVMRRRARRERKALRAARRGGLIIKKVA